MSPDAPSSRRPGGAAPLPDASYEAFPGIQDRGRGRSVLLRGFTPNPPYGPAVNGCDSARLFGGAGKFGRSYETQVEESGWSPPAVPLIHENVFLLSLGYRTRKEDFVVPAEAVAAWYSHFGWDSPGAVRMHSTVSVRPVEDGFFRCLRVRQGAGLDAEADEGRWTVVELRGATVAERICSFIEDEAAARGADRGTSAFERYLLDHYRRRLGWRGEGPLHPAILMMGSLDFDGFADLEFAGSVWSANELRFWSRPVYLGK